MYAATVLKKKYITTRGTIRRYGKLNHCPLRQTQMQILFILSPV